MDRFFLRHSLTQRYLPTVGRRPTLSAPELLNLDFRLRISRNRSLNSRWAILPFMRLAFIPAKYCDISDNIRVESGIIGYDDNQEKIEHPTG